MSSVCVGPTNSSLHLSVPPWTPASAGRAAIAIAHNIINQWIMLWVREQHTKNTNDLWSLYIMRCIISFCLECSLHFGHFLQNCGLWLTITLEEIYTANEVDEEKTTWYRLARMRMLQHLHCLENGAPTYRTDHDRVSCTARESLQPPIL